MSGVAAEGIQHERSCNKTHKTERLWRNCTNGLSNPCEMYLMQTVSAVPRPRTAAHVETKPYGNAVHGEYPKQKTHSLENGMINHARIYELGTNETEARSEIKNEDVIGVESDKKKEKKWSLGGFFRRKNKKDADDSSEDSGEKMGFLRRKSKRERRKKTRSTNGFDVVIPQHKEISAEHLWSGEPKQDGPVRYIHRHPEKPKEALQVPKRRDSRSSGGSENAEMRKGRKEVMARAEAKRDMMRDESSSDECDSHHSNSSLSRLNAKRRDRHKRLSRDDEREDLRIIKSDFEGRRMPSRWMRTYPEISDQDIRLINHSGTPSPCMSPRARQRQLQLQYMYMQNGYPTSTFPPNHYQPALSPARKEAPLNYRNPPQRNRLPDHYSRSIDASRKTLTDYEQYLNSCGREKSLSYDHNIHRATYFRNDEGNYQNIPKPNRYVNGDVHKYPHQNGVMDTRQDVYKPNFVQPVQRSLSNNTFNEAAVYPHRSSSYHHIPPRANYPRVEQIPNGYKPQSPKENFYPNRPNVDIPPKSLNGSPSILRYYADQNPRSRNPIHITCNPTNGEQPYLSDSQMVIRPPIRNASDFWKLKDQEIMRQKSENTLKPPTDRSRSNSPRMEMMKPRMVNGVTQDNKALKEKYNVAKQTSKPPEPPVRRLSKQEVLARLQKCEQQTKSQQHSNLDEALNELEIIYNSLRLKDEDERKNSQSQSSIPVNKSVPDKTDDMAFRRLNNPKDRIDVKKLPSHSYLRSSPAHSPIPPSPRKESPILEPDVTLDDVVFRNIRHANSTLKISDPQPPFGIPIGVVSPAPNSDYLHATPKDRFRPSFASSKTPDVVKDDLAFRNLRKDNRTPSDSLLKKRAVRSLSANLYNIMQKDELPVETNNNTISPKTQSLTDLTNGKDVLEKRLKELKEEKNVKRAEFFEARKKENLSWTDLANLNGNFEEQKSSEDPSRKYRSPIVELSRYPAAVPLSTLQGNPFKEHSTVTPVDEEALEHLLSALANEAKNASKDLERQLDRLEMKSVDEIPVKEIKPLVEEFNRKFKTNTLEKNKRRRNLSLSTVNESKEETRKTNSLERRKKPNPMQFEDVWVTKPTRNIESSKTIPNIEQKLAKSDSASSIEKSQRFEVITDLSQILQEVEQHLNPEREPPKETNGDIFQQVYEYNCNLDTKGEVEVYPRSDVDTEFEKLHEEVNKTKDTEVDDLLADVTSVNHSASNYASFPFPNDEQRPSCSRGSSRARDGSGSNRGQGESKKVIDSNVWLACSYALAFAFHLQEIDFLTALGIVLAVVSVVALLIL